MGETIIGAILSFIGLVIGSVIVDRIVRPVSKLIVSELHVFHFSVPNPNGAKNTHTLYRTQDIVVQNLGRGIARNVEILFNYAPDHFELWPVEKFTTSKNEDGRYFIHLERLNPKDLVQVELLCVNELPDLLHVKYDGGQAVPKNIKWIVWPNRYVRVIVGILMAVGAFSILYFLIVITGLAGLILGIF